MTTQTEIIETAIQAGYEYAASYTQYQKKMLIDFAKLVAAKEREALLQVVYGYASNLEWNEDFQADIEARGEA